MVLPFDQEAEVRGQMELRSWRPAWAAQQDLTQKKNMGYE
jgi:hypothetical protein